MAAMCFEVLELKRRKRRNLIASDSAPWREHMAKFRRNLKADFKNTRVERCEN